MLATRPIYETNKDLAREREIADAIGRVWDCDVQKMPVKYRVDYALFAGGSLIAWLEIKCRNNRRDFYKDYMISADKLMAGINLAHHFNVPFLLCVKWSDQTAYIAIERLSDFRIEFGGRKDRKDGQDVEPVAMIPVDKFENLLVKK